MFENMKESVEVKKSENNKVVYIGPNIQGLLNGTVFNYMPDLKNYEEYKNIEKLFIPLASLKEETLKIRENSGYLSIIYENIVEIKNKKGSVK